MASDRQADLLASAAKVTVGVATVAVIAGLTFLPLPAFAPIGEILQGARNASEPFSLQSHPPTPPPLLRLSRRRPSRPNEDTDYSTWSEADLAAASVEQPHSGLINHPSRFAPGCLQNSDLMGGTLRGPKTLVDMGPREFAAGEAVRDANGALVGYTVEPGDAGSAVGERFCIDYVTVLSYNGRWGTGGAIQPGDVMTPVP